MRLFSCIRLAPVVFISLALAVLIFILPVSTVTLRSSVASMPEQKAETSSDSIQDQMSSMQMDFVNHISDLLWSDSVDLAKRGDETLANVEQAAKAIDMTVVHPYESFSFNETVGVRSEDKGYRPGLMYSSGQVVTGVGGGICIVSTLLYNGALETGLKIIERHPHSGTVSYADPGRDAAVVHGTKDLCFKNNTGSLMLIRAIIEDKQLTISLYGKALPGRSVEIISKDYQEIPYAIIENEDASLQDGQVVVDQKAKLGFSVTIVRITKEDGKLLSREEISHDVVQPVNKMMRIPSRENISSSPSPAHRPFEGPDEEANEQMQPKTGVISVPDIDVKESLAN